MKEIETLKEWFKESENIVFFGGAGVSTESGIPDFRSEQGIYSKEYDYPPEYMLSREFFDLNTAKFYDFYLSELVYSSAKPNAAHYTLAQLEDDGKLKAVITQNVDGLHQAAGSRNVIELHGSAERNYCMRCRSLYSLKFIIDSNEVPKCKCGGVIKPDVVLYGEQLPDTAFKAAERAIRSADLFIIGGTSLTVYPAAGLVSLYGGERLVLINKSPTTFDSGAALIIRAPIGETLQKAYKAL